MFQTWICICMIEIHIRGALILHFFMQTDLIPKVQAALLMIVTKDVTGLIGRGQFEEALPVVMDAVLKGQALYFPHDPLNLVPVYLLAVQVST